MATTKKRKRQIVYLDSFRRGQLQYNVVNTRFSLDKTKEKRFPSFTPIQLVSSTLWFLCSFFLMTVGWSRSSTTICLRLRMVAVTRRRCRTFRTFSRGIYCVFGFQESHASRGCVHQFAALFSYSVFTRQHHWYFMPWQLVGL
jgi:hypothetical protein